MKLVGVVIARFQVPSLHAGHMHLIDYVLDRHKDALVVFGESRAGINLHDPLDTDTRALMLAEHYDGLRVASIRDCRHDWMWSGALDEAIAEKFPGREAVLYGSRDSFIPHYSGRHAVEFVPAMPDCSGTAMRNGGSAIASVDFRKGMIYAAKQRWPVSYQTVDAAVIDYAGQRVLVGSRKEDCGLWRFIGGFVDPADVSLERAAKREVGEEAPGIETDAYTYLGSFRVDDWRYRCSSDKILTALFAATYVFGHLQAGDDIDDLRWVDMRDDIVGLLIDEHKPLGERLVAHLGTAAIQSVAEGL